MAYHIKFSHEGCKENDIGKTERILMHRLKDHVRENFTPSCRQHEKSTAHKMDYKNVEILDTASNDMKLRTKELVHILIRKPTLNKQLNSQSDFEIRTLLIKAYPRHRKNLNPRTRNGADVT